MRRVLAYVGVTVVLVAAGLFVTAQIDLRTFTAGDVIRAAEVNENFETLAAAIGASVLPVACAPGDVAAWDGAAWACAPGAGGEVGAGVTSVTAGAGLTGGGTTGDVVLALDVDAADDRYHQEVAPTPGVFLTAPPTVQSGYANLDEPFTTTKSGRLLVTKYFRGAIACSEAAGRYYFITVDGIPVRSSAVFQPNDQPLFAGTLVGTTDDVVPAGDHTLGVGAQCTNGTASGSSSTIVSVSSVVVLRE